MKSRINWTKFFLIVAASLVVIWTLFPFIWYFLVSLTVPGYIPRRLEIPDVLTLRSYGAVLFGGDFASVGAKFSILPNILNSFIVASFTVLLCLIISTGAAYGFSRYKFRGRRILFNSLLVIRMTPGISLAVPIFLMMAAYKLIDTHIGLSMVYTVLAMPMAIWLMKGFFDTIPIEIEEAASIDGASRFTTVWRIVLPLTAPGIAVTSCFLFLSSYIEFMFALILSRGNINTLPLGIASYQSEHQTFFNEMAAASFISMIPLAIFFYLVGRYMVSGLSLGALK